MPGVELARQMDIEESQVDHPHDDHPASGPPHREPPLDDPGSKPPPRRRRQRTTKASVRWLDRISYLVIVIGGISTIAAVCTVMLYLLTEVWPLFQGTDFEQDSQHQVSFVDEPAQEAAAIGVGELSLVGWRLGDAGEVQSFDIAHGKPLASVNGFAARPTALATYNEQVVAGFTDGRIQIGTLAVEPTFFYLDQADPSLHKLPEGETVSHDNGVVMRISGEQFRQQTLAVNMEEPIDGGIGAIDAADLATDARGNTIVALHGSSGTVGIVRVQKKQDRMTRKIRITIKRTEIDLSQRASQPEHLLLMRQGTFLLAIWADGQAERYSLSDFAKPTLVETIDLVPDDDATLTVARLLLGEETILIGDDRGHVQAWFPIRSQQETMAPDDPGDGMQLVLAHDLPRHDAAVRSINISYRMRMIAVAYDDGHHRVMNVTTGHVVADGQSTLQPPPTSIALTPKDDGVLLGNGEQVEFWHMDSPHPDISLSALFFPVWYEGYDAPQAMWQSTGGSDSAEAKLGLWPLVFGTLKATIYAMIFAIPVAILGAIFATEFMPQEISRRIKPVIEMMASLPSVVLGFIAGIELAPLVEGTLPIVIAAFVVVPATFLLGGHCWQLLPQGAVQRWRPLWLAGCLPVGIAFSWIAGPLAESLFFGGNIQVWLNGEAGGAAIGGWLLLFLPLSGLAVAFLFGRRVTPWLDRTIGATKGRKALANWSLLAFFGAAVLTFAIALVISSLLSGVGLDARGEGFSGFISTYNSRNAMIVGIVMGFAVIPLIYTISEDALRSVPNMLRAASLGCGATPWQTAVRVIVPTAASGLFSATMIGLGRAVGETMIVLMATGNTPVLDLNVFNGMRTLSANIAVELPEAPVGSTHYRILFLTALILFVMTFVLNTAAELVRQRFRRRAASL